MCLRPARSFTRVRSYLFAVAVTVASALASALLLRRKLAKLDLIGVLKTRE